MTKQFIKGLIEKTANGGYQVLASTSSVDRQGDVIDQNGWELDNYKKNPVMLWAHDYSSLPVAKVSEITVDARGLVASYEFASADGNPMAAQIKELVDGGFINAVSVGFIPKERNGSVISKSELLEISFVPVPANQDALTLAVSHFGAELAAKMFIAEEKEVEEKGEVSDALDEEEAMEAKYEKMNEVWEVMSAFCDVYFDPATDVEQFASLLTETIGLLQQLVATDGADDDADEGMKAALTEKVAALKSKTASEKVHSGTLALLQKIGARHSSETKKAIAGAMEHTKSATSLLSTLIEGEQSGQESAPENADDEELKGGDELRALLITRNLLREGETGSRFTLGAINRLIESRK